VPIPVLPFGYVAHDAAADPAAPLDAAVTVGAYSRLGATPALVAPANARSLVEERARR